MAGGRFKATSAGMSAPTSLSDPAQEELRGLLYAPDSPITAATRDVDRFFDTPTGQNSCGLQRKIDELDATRTPARRCGPWPRSTMTSPRNR